MQLSATSTKLALGLIAVLVVFLAYILLTRRAAPVPAPGQTVQNPFGSQVPGAGGAPNQAGNAAMGNLPPGMTLPQRGTPTNSMPFSNEQFRRMMSNRKTGQ